MNRLKSDFRIKKKFNLFQILAYSPQNCQYIKRKKELAVPCSYGSLPAGQIPGRLSSTHNAPYPTRSFGYRISPLMLLAPR